MNGVKVEESVVNYRVNHTGRISAESSISSFIHNFHFIREEEAGNEMEGDL